MLFHFQMRNWIAGFLAFLPAVLFAQLSVSFIKTNASCFGDCDGSVIAVASGGSFPYSYQWSGGTSAAALSNLCAGAYAVTVTDAAQNTLVDSVVIIQPNLLTVEISPENQICGVAPDGSATAVPSGGTAPYAYLWSTGGTTSKITGLAEGTYTVTVTDFNGCTAVNQTQIFFWNEGLWLMITHTDILCFGDNNGTTHIGVMTGTSPYTYDWGSGFPNGPDLANLAPGTYTVTVTDANGCSNSASATVLEPPPLQVAADSLAAACNKPGGATVTPSGGTPPYGVLWSTGDSTFAISAPAGPVTVTVTDANGCQFSLDLSIPDNSVVLSATAAPLSNAGCLTGGSASAAATGGSGIYTFNWSNGDSTAIAANLAAGTYTVTITETPTGCSTTAAVTIAQSPAPAVLAEIAAPVRCDALGTITATASNGTAPYSYLWSSGDTTATAPDLPAGTYTVTATDAAGCTAIDSVTLVQPLIPMVTITGVVQITCLATGSATATATGGTAPYVYLWSSGDSTATASNLTVGAYTVTATDANSCPATASFTLGPPPIPAVTITGVVQITCLATGSATATATGAAAPYSYLWSSGDSTATASSLAVGTYTVTATDAGGCTATATIAMAAPPIPLVDITGVVHATCQNAGSATANASGGTPPYTFLWDNAETNATAVNLGPGIHTVTVTDAGGCSVTGTVQVLQIGAPTVSAQAGNPANCLGAGGSATATAAGGVLPYLYVWNNGDSTATATNLAATTYTVTVTDAIGCTATATVAIAQAPLPTVSISVTAPATCLTPASALATPAGGTPPYSYGWSNGQLTAAATGLLPGAFTVTVTDLNFCTAVGSVVVAEPPKPSISIVSATNANCSTPGSATTQTTGGTPGYTYLWDNNETTANATNLAQGVHTVTVTDTGGCTATASITIGFSGTGGIKLGDFVWNDITQDGFQDPTETGAPNITVKLIQPGPDGIFGNADDVTVATTITDSNGKYTFDCVTAGTYAVKFSGLPANYEFSPKNSVNNDCKDSDANTNGQTDPFTVTTSQGNNNCVDAGIHVICQNVTNAGTVCCAQTICEGETPALLYETVPPSGGVGNLIYLWMQLVQVGAAPPTWMAIPGATAPSYQPGPLYETAYFIRCVRRENCPNFLETNIVQITVLPAGSSNCPQFLNYFRVSALSSATVKLEWETPAEMIQYLYQVERSSDQAVWVTVEEVFGHKEAISNAYTVMDHAPNGGMNYYRIKRRSAAGTESVSDVREIELSIEWSESLAVYPNPATDVLYVRNLTPYDADARVHILTASGQLLYSLKIPAGTLQQYEIPVTGLPEGLYLTRIRFGNGDIKTLKVTKFRQQ
ncbi:MAG: T9SS type A sorting domain-containing protein [Saprospirales bacterium]|nr:T9SS type A sorting domain-containing protein [Saprospirales bacterium]